MTWIKYITPLAIALVMAATFPASAGSLPPLINFQSVLLDEGGNLLPSGPTTIQFQILDENHTPIYSESQSVEVIKGAASALIGNGADTKGAPTGGVPDDVFATGAPRYLQVQVGSHAPEDPMTIVPVPYSQWSATCATVADGGVKPASIANAAVGFEALAPDVVSKLADAMSKSQGVVTAQSLSSTGGATQVGVTAKFINSGSTSVQGVLQDIDLSVKKGQETDTFLTGKLNQEVTDRQNAISKEVSDRSNAIQSLKTNDIKQISDGLAQETSNRTSADGGLQSQINTEIQNRQSADTALQQNITNETSARQSGDTFLKSYIDQQIAIVTPATSSPITPIIKGEVAWSDFSFYKYTASPPSTTITANFLEGIKFIPFNEAEILAQNTCTDASGHVCNYAEILADDKLYHCKVGIKFNLQGHTYASGGGINATCEYTTRIMPSSINDGDGGNLDYAVQKGILVHIYDIPKSAIGPSGGFSASGAVSVLYTLYQIQVATQ